MEERWIIREFWCCAFVIGGDFGWFIFMLLLIFKMVDMKGKDGILYSKAHFIYLCIFILC